MAEYINFYTPVVGRFVRGSLTQRNTKDPTGRVKPDEKQQYEFNVAFPKADIWPWLSTEFYQKLMQALAGQQDAMNRANIAFQQGFPKGVFSLKIYDGDTPNQKGQVNPNTQGCFVMSFTSRNVPQCVAGPARTEVDASAVERGFFVQVNASMKYNSSQGDNTGVYLNTQLVWCVAEGERIAEMGIDPNEAFGATPAALPPGARPLGAGNGSAAAFGGAPAPQQPQYAAPAPQQPQYAAPAPQQPQYAAPAPQQPQYAAPAPQQPQYAAPAPVGFTPPPAQVGTQTVAAPMPGMAFTQPPAPTTTASFGSTPPAPPAGVAPYTGAMQMPLSPQQ
jgi:hypothetical protein